ncbi:MAG: TetR/AcrR family transcriptional regulator [Eggerthellaceae bacterium]
MALPKNQKLINDIVNASWRLFLEKGYKDTTYSDIATACGVSKISVQNNFPLKSTLAAANLERLRFCAAKVEHDEFPSVEDAFSKMFLLGQIYIAALLSSQGSRAFLGDILESRLLTEETISNDFRWSLKYAFGTVEAAQPSSQLRQDLIVAMGGLYELIYFNLASHKPFDIAQRMQPGMTVFGMQYGLGEKERNEVFKQFALNDKKLQELGGKALKLVSQR